MRSIIVITQAWVRRQPSSGVCRWQVINVRVRVSVVWEFRLIKGELALLGVCLAHCGKNGHWVDEGIKKADDPQYMHKRAQVPATPPRGSSVHTGPRGRQLAVKVSSSKLPVSPARPRGTPMKRQMARGSSHRK
ncbi:hypothetical protein NDU88_003661 [Pleurodeles waltl]|uniref:Uncharacterized protein n=1 Tax=Pleurodeles waltl TaxID=8319 RepID=A0AAV7KW76_PLEWA|nr:hypothetical protein NDU88_003661 [Pleurodeles waltl]